MDEPIGPDIEAIYRMVALGCAALVTDKAKDHTAVLAVADSFLEYIDPLVAADQGVRFTCDKTVGKGKQAPFGQS